MGAVIRQIILNSKINDYKKQIEGISRVRVDNAGANYNEGKISSLKDEYNAIETSIRSAQKGSETLADIQSKLNTPSVLNGISSSTEKLNSQDLELVRLNEHYKKLELSSKSAQSAQQKSIKSDISVATKMPTNNLDEANEKLNKLQELRKRISNNKTPLLSPSEIQS